MLTNLLAFFFSVIYYLIKGLWRKAILLLCIHIVIVTLVFLLLPYTYQDKVLRIVTLIVPTIAAASANYDLYRKHVLKQTFWW